MCVCLCLLAYLKTHVRPPRKFNCCECSVNMRADRPADRETCRRAVSSTLQCRSVAVVLRVRLRCERTQVRISPRTATVIRSLGHGLHTSTTVPRSTQPCIPPVSLNRVPASAGGKDGNVTSAGWQVTLCDPVWHVSFCGGVAVLHCELLHPYT